MRSVPGSHFTFEWNPTRGDLGVGNLAQYYPGNQYVDDIGLDVYDLEQQTYPGAKAEFRHMLTQRYGLNWLATFAAAHDKPIVLPEWGLGLGTCSASGQPITASGQQVCGGDNATWVNLMANGSTSHHVVEATYWDFGTSSVRRGHNPARRCGTHLAHRASARPTELAEPGGPDGRRAPAAGTPRPAQPSHREDAPRTRRSKALS